MTNSTIDNLINSIGIIKAPYSQVPNVSFALPKGNRKFKILMRSSYSVSNSFNINSYGVWITIRHHGLKFPIGSRRWYSTYDDALNVVTLWQTLINESNTGYGNICFAIYDADSDYVFEL